MSYFCLQEMMSVCSGCESRRTLRHQSVRAQLRQFCETTSVKGVSRAVKADRLWLRAVWTLAVVVFIASAALYVYNLINDYYRYPKSVTLEEGSTVGKDASDLSPSLTVCNIRPFSKRNYSDDIITYSEYVNMVQEELLCPDCKGRHLGRFKDTLLSMLGYYQYLGQENAEIVGHRYEDFVLACHVVIRKGSSLSSAPCEKYANVSLLKYPDYFNCYTLVPKSGKEVIGFSLVLYVDSAQHEFQMNTRSRVDPKYFSKGAIATYKERFTFPFVTKTGLVLSPGEFTTIKLKLEQRIRLPPPYDRCVERSDVSFVGQDGSPVLYDGHTCWTACAEDRVVRDCGCKDAGFPGVLYWKHIQYPYCADMHAPIYNLTARLNCSLWARWMSSVPCYYRCPLPCDEISYTPVTSYLAWPALSQVHKFYEKYVEGHPVQQLFGSIHQLTDGECVSLRDCSKKEDVYNKILKNFLGVKVFVPDPHFTQTVTDKHFTLPSLISQLGGALNLWSGISIVVIVEIGELLIKILIRIKQKCFATEIAASKWHLHKKETIISCFRNRLESMFIQDVVSWVTAHYIVLWIFWWCCYLHLTIIDYWRVCRKCETAFSSIKSLVWIRCWKLTVL